MKEYRDFDLTEYNSYRVKAFCRRAFFPESDDDFLEIFRELGQTEKVLIGSGHNIVLSKEYYDEDFVIVGSLFSRAAFESNNVLSAEAGADMRWLSEQAAALGLSGLEIFYDIPSSLGGAVVMNAGASGEEVKDVLLRVKYLDLADYAFKELERAQMDFTYRNSFFQSSRDKVIVKAWLQLQPGDRQMIREKMERIKAARWVKQPKDFPNAGSVFKRPPGHYVGELIDRLSLKGYQIGGARISDKHGGFIINTGNATGADIVQLIAYVREQVYKQIGVDLEVEQRII